MDIKANRPTAAGMTTIIQGPQNSNDSSLFSRMIVRTMLEDLASLTDKKAPTEPLMEKPATIAAAISPLSPSAPLTAPPAPPPAIAAETAKSEITAAKENEKKHKKELAQKIREEEKQAKEAQKESRRAARETATLARETTQKIARTNREATINNYQQARSAYAAGGYASASELTQKVIADQFSSWLLKFKAKRLNKKAEIARQQPAKTQTIDQATSAKKETTDIPVPSAPTPPARISPIAAPPANLPTLTEAAAVAPRPIPKPPSPRPVIPDLTPMPAKTPPTLLAERPNYQRILIIGSSLTAVVLLFFFGWRIAGKKTADEPTILPPSISPIFSASLAPSISPLAPQPLIAADKQKTIELLSADTLKEILRGLTPADESAGAVTVLTVKNDQGDPITIDRVINDLGWKFFNEPIQNCETAEICLTAKNLREFFSAAEFSFLFYSQNNASGDDFSPFTANLASNENRWGLIIKLPAGGASSTLPTIQLMNALKDLEIFLPAELSSLLPTGTVIPPNPIFSQTIYQNTAVRYLNLPNADLTIDYAVTDQKFILTTSKESMLTIIDRLKKTASDNE